MSAIQVIRRGYLFCSVSCVCEMCIYADDWFRLLLDWGVAMFKDGAKELPGPSEFRGRAA